MIRHLLRAAAVMLCLGPSVAAAQVPGEGAAQPDAVRVIVAVTDQSTNERMLNAEVLLVGSDASMVRPAAESDGRYAFPLLPPGSYELVVRSLGYHEVRRAVDVGLDGDTQIGVALVPEALQLDAIVVTTPAPRNRFMAGFDERRELGMGRFVTRDVIEQIRPNQVSDVLRLVPGTYFIPGNTPMRFDVLLENPARDVIRPEPCRPAIYLDGLYLARFEEDDTVLDDIINPERIEAIEVYKPYFAPAQFAHVTECGALVLWTRVDPVQEAPIGSLWKPALAGVLLLTIMNWLAN